MIFQCLECFGLYKGGGREGIITLAPYAFQTWIPLELRVTRGTFTKGLNCRCPFPIAFAIRLRIWVFGEG